MVSVHSAYLLVNRVKFIGAYSFEIARYFLLQSIGGVSFDLRRKFVSRIIIFSFGVLRHWNSEVLILRILGTVNSPLILSPS